MANREEATGLLFSLGPDPATRTPSYSFARISFAIPPCFLGRHILGRLFSLAVWDMELARDEGVLGS